MAYVKKAMALSLLVILPAVAACGGAKAEVKPGSRATVVVEGTTYAVSDVKFGYQPGERGHFRIDGHDASHADEECVPGVRSGLTLSGDLPPSVNSPAELSDREVAFDVSGDRGNHHLCFVGSTGLLGVEKGTVTFGRVYGGAMAFAFSGDFKRSDRKGGKAESTVHVSGSGTATIE